jgi:hypothetical protein
MSFTARGAQSTVVVVAHPNVEESPPPILLGATFLFLAMPIHHRRRARRWAPKVDDKIKAFRYVKANHVDEQTRSTSSRRRQIKTSVEG